MGNLFPSNDWLIRNVPQDVLSTEKTLAVIGAKLNLKRLEMGMDQKKFAKFMGVTQGVVSRWESGTYNFTISELFMICKKLNLVLNVDVKHCRQDKDNMGPLVMS